MHKAQKAAFPGEEAERPVLTRLISVDEVADAEERLIEATDAERAAIARLLDLVALDRLHFTYRPHNEDEGRIGLTGTLSAQVTQTCVVSLEPVQSTLEVPMSVEFWPQHLIGDLEAKMEEPAGQGLLDWPEPIVEGAFDLGPVIYESLATGLDPYPRKEGAQFAWRDEAGGAETPAGPFAALAKLKQR